MPPYTNASHDHPLPPPASQNALADPPRSSIGSTTSYTTLAHALAPEPSRASSQPYYRQSTSSASRSSPRMASDSRYMYHQPQEVAPAPPYPYPYPAAPYDSYAQGSSRPPVRSPPPLQPVQHPPQPTYNGAPPAYPPQPGYPPPGYGVHPPHPQHWSGEWSHYNAPYPPAPPPGQQSAYPPPSGPRSDLSPSASNEDRRYPQQPQRPEPRRTEDRPPQRPEAAPPPPAPVRKTRDNEHPTPAPAPPPPLPVQAQAPPTPTAAPSIPPPGIGVDFSKLLESYRLILDTTTPLQCDPHVVRPPAGPDSLERMLQAATYGAQVLDAAVKRSMPDPPRAPAPEEGDGEALRNRQSDNGPATEGQTCLGCSATSTPEWRRGPMGPRTLCNACGLVYAKLIKKRNRDGPGRQRGQHAKQNSQGAAHSAPADDHGGASSGEGSDDDSYGSQQDRQSDMPYRGGRE